MNSTTGLEACSETILLAEDELMVRAVTVTILREEGFFVLETSDGDEALRVANQQEGKKIDLLLSDIMMPRMSGIDLYQQFSSQYPDLPVLLMSGYTTESIPRSSGPDKRSVSFQNLSLLQGWQKRSEPH